MKTFTTSPYVSPNTSHILNKSSRPSIITSHKQKRTVDMTSIAVKSVKCVNNVDGSQNWVLIHCEHQKRQKHIHSAKTLCP